MIGLSRTALAVPTSLAMALAALLCSSAVAAQVDPTAAARDLFREGVALAEAERWEEAASRFERAYELRRSAPIAVNWAHALERMGRWVQASELLARVRRDETLDEATRELAGQRFDALRPRIPRLTVRVSGATAGVTITLDGHPVDPGLFHVAVPIDPGDHELLALRGDEEIARRRFTVVEREQHEEAITIAPSARAAAAAADPSGDGGSSEPVAGEEAWETWWFWTIVGVLVAGAVATTVGLVVGLDGQGPAAVQGNGTPPIIVVGP